MVSIRACLRFFEEDSDHFIDPGRRPSTDPLESQFVRSCTKLLCELVARSNEFVGFDIEMLECALIGEVENFIEFQLHGPQFAWK